MSLIATLVQAKCVPIFKFKCSSIAKSRLHKYVIHFTLKLYAKYAAWCLLDFFYVMIHVIKHDMDTNSNINYSRKIPPVQCM